MMPLPKAPICPRVTYMPVKSGLVDVPGKTKRANEAFRAALHHDDLMKVVSSAGDRLSEAVLNEEVVQTGDYLTLQESGASRLSTSRPSTF